MVNYRKIAQQVAGLLTKVLEPAGYQATPSLLPLKSLAAHSGLAVYGRNNICYVPGMGSFLELVGLYSDLPCSEDTWQEARTIDKLERLDILGDLELFPRNLGVFLNIS